MNDIKVKGYYEAVCHDVNGNEKWRDNVENLVVNTGLNHMLNVTFNGDTQESSWFMGLTDGTPTVAAGDTAASHAGWVEVTAYSEGARQAFTNVVASESITNSASAAVFTASGSTTVGGLMLISNSTKGGTTGVLFSAGAFATGDKTLATSETITVTYTANMSAS